MSTSVDGESTKAHTVIECSDQLLFLAYPDAFGDTKLPVPFVRLN